MGDQSVRNKFLNAIEKEWESFLRPKVKQTQHVFQNYEKPLPKSTGKKLNRLIKLYGEVEILQKQKEFLQAMIGVATAVEDQKEKTKLEKSWAKAHDKQLKHASKYVQLKKTLS